MMKFLVLLYFVLSFYEVNGFGSDTKLENDFKSRDLEQQYSNMHDFKIHV